jgi:ribose transport system ATP-binding protein
MAQKSPVLRAEDVTVSFSGNLALDSVSITVGTGSLVGLVGENGAGKSTLLNVLSGTIRPDRGRIWVHGQRTEVRTPQDATRAGIFRVHQEPALIGQLSVAENLVLGLDRQFRRGPVILRKRMTSHARRVLDELGFDYDATRLVRRYSFGACQLIELARVIAVIDALQVAAPIVLLDEPTAALSGSEMQSFERYLEILRSTRNASVVFVSHRLSETIAYCDELVVLKDGSVVTTTERSSTVEDLHKLMVGRERATDYFAESQQCTEFGELVGEISIGLLESNSLTIRQGEIVGVAGLPRSGKHELAEAVAGVSHWGTHEVRLFGTRAGRTLRSRMSAGVAYVPLDRATEGISQGMSVSDNIANASWTDWSRFGVRRVGTESQISRDLVKHLNIRTASIAQRAGSLSGGNQQKVVFARWIARKVRLLIADNPTRGVDAGAKEEIYRILRQLATDGTAILLVSDDLPEIIGLSNRIYVIRDGKLTAELVADANAKPQEHQIIKYMV